MAHFRHIPCGSCVNESERKAIECLKPFLSLEVLQANTSWLERRLRDLGLLIGVNDASSMKQLKPRYPSWQEAEEVVA